MTGRFCGCGDWFERHHLHYPNRPTANKRGATLHTVPMSAVRKRLVANAEMDPTTVTGPTRARGGLGTLSRLHTLAVVLVAALAVTAGTAQAQPSDLAPTRVYIQADYALSRSAKAHQSIVEASIRAYTRQLGRECPRVAIGAPQDTEAEQLYEEIVSAATGMVYRSDGAAIVRFAGTVQGLHWSSAKLTSTVHSYATRLRALAALPVPDVCADARAWVASHYTALPAATTAAGQRLRVGEMGPMEVPLELFARYEQPAEARTIAATKRLEEGLQEAEATQGTGDISKLVGIIGLNP